MSDRWTRVGVWTVVAVAGALASCATVEGDWRVAKQSNTIGGYQSFVKKYPGSSYEREARKGIETLRYEEARRVDQVAYYERFKRDYPKSEYSPEVSRQLNMKRSMLQSLPLDRILLEQESVDAESSQIHERLSQVLGRMDIQLLRGLDVDVDGVLMIGKPTREIKGSLMDGSRPMLVISITRMVSLKHKQGGLIFQENVDSGGGFAPIRAVGSTLVVEGDVARPVQTGIATEIPRLIIEYFGANRFRRQVPEIIAGLKNESDTVVREGFAAILKKISGRNYGVEYERWARWWEEEQGKSKESIGK